MVVCGVDTATTDATGYYHIFNILEGTYDATATLFGYNPQTAEVVITAGSTTTQDFYMPQPIISVDITSIEAPIPPGGSHEETFNISNMGDGTLDFEIDVEQAGRMIDVFRSVTRHEATSAPARSTETSKSAPRIDTGPVGRHVNYSFGSDADVAPASAPYRPEPPVTTFTDEILWEIGANMPTARYSGVTGTYDGEIFVAVGRDNASSPYNTDVVEAYDYSSDTWRTNCTSAPTARRMVAGGAMYADEYLYAIGGRNTTSTTVGNNEIYDMSTDTWTTGAACTPRWAHAGAVLDGYVYVFGGTPTTTTERYNIATNTWESLPSMPNAAGWLGGCTAAGKVYAVGGSGTETVMREYDPATNTWSLKAPIPHGRLYARCVAHNDLVYSCGGDQGGNNIDVYDPATNTWITETNMPATISWQQMGVSEAAIYVIGGTPTSSPVVYQNQVWIGPLAEPAEPWIWVSPEEGTIEPGSSEMITVTFLMPDTAIVGDVYTADIFIDNNTITPTITIPVTVTIVEAVDESVELLPMEYALYQNYPNPFNPTTRIRFDLRERSHVLLEVYNILGQKVVTLLDRSMDAGRYNADFDATRLASGVYFYRITANNFTDLKKMILIR